MNFCLRYWCQAAQQLPHSQTLIRALRAVFGASFAAQTSQLSAWPPLGKTACLNKAESRSRSLFLQPEWEAEYLRPTYQATSLIAVCLPLAVLLPASPLFSITSCLSHLGPLSVKDLTCAVA